MKKALLIIAVAGFFCSAAVAAENEYVFTVYPWGFGQPLIKGEAVSMTDQQVFNILQTCKSQALNKLAEITADFDGIATIDPKTARVTCQTKCQISKDYPSMDVCEAVYRWTGTGIGVNPGDDLPQSIPQRRARQRALKNLENLREEFEALMKGKK